MKRTFSFILIILIFLSSVALGTSQQSANKEKQRVCGSETNYPVGHPMHKYFQEKQKDIERRIDDYLSKQKVKDLKNYNAEVNNGIITIPVVFHIFHYGTPIGVDENISALHILAQVSQLNDDFRRTNSDASNTVPAFASVAADTEIEFCVASYDPFGFPTNGVVRHNINNFVSTSPGECITDNTVDGSIKPFTIWDSAKFLNVWVIPDICGLYGFAQFPEESENTDGVALISSCIGALNYPSALPGERSHGRILTHEVGHFLNLYHTFSGGCSNLDFVDDTPAISESSSACNLTQVSCGSLDMVQIIWIIPMTYVRIYLPKVKKLG